MQSTSLFLTLSGFLLFVAACQPKSDFEQRLSAMEARLTAQYTNERSDSLVNLYREAIKSHPEDNKTNLRYFTRAAEIQFTLRKDGTSAARWIEDAMIHYSNKEDRGDIIGLYTRIWNEYNYKTAATVHLDPKDIDAMRNRLRDNLPWIDSALVRIDKKMSTGGVVTDKALSVKFIEIAEGYATLTSSQDRYAEMMMKAAGLAKSTENYNKAIQLYFKLSERLPDHASSKAALFMQGFIYENDLKDLQKAKKLYEDYLNRFPLDTLYADDARMALKTLGKTPEELIESFQQQSKNQ